ncbi:MAG: FAD-linked oxidase C-terminal domain-containing protein [Candidatus Hinthialibacter antarcticus]|nr:FAD-linked oxidase C-terminal domain-containing protein [Candidatus Hinthialibacter antarcticus]
MTTTSIASELKAIFPADRITTDPVDMMTYSFDGTPNLSATPAAVVYPETTEEVAQLMKWASQNNVKIVPRGSGTGLSGGSVPIKGGVVMCTVRMDKILEIDDENLTVMAQPGVITADLAAAVLEKGLFYPPDPGSMKISTIGGNVVENSGGLRCLKYGVTEDYVMGLEVVLPDGEILWTGSKSKKDVAGYNLKKILVSSEGTLGVITKVLLRLIPPPKDSKTMLAYFTDMVSAGNAVKGIIAGKIIPCALEFLDNVTINCVEDFSHIGLPRDIGALLLIQTDGHPAQVAEETEAIEAICKEQGATEFKIAQTQEEAEQLASARRMALSALARRKPTTILEDATVPRNRVPEMLAFIEQVRDKYQLDIGTFGHAGDGNLHPTCLTDERNHEEMERVEQCFDEIFKKAIELGGTVTGEHGVGCIKSKYLPMMVGETGIKVMRRIKESFDPQGILNPGKIFIDKE